MGRGKQNLQNETGGREEDPGAFQLRTNFTELGKKKKLKGNPKVQRGGSCCGDLAFQRGEKGNGADRGEGSKGSIPPLHGWISSCLAGIRGSSCPNVRTTYGVLFAYIDIGLCAFLCQNTVSYLQRQLHEVTQTIFRAQGL